MIINVTGLGHSGKTLIYDTFNDEKTQDVLPSSVEFELLRMPNGFMDLLESIKFGSDPIRYNFIISNLINQLERMSKPVSLFKPWTYLIRTGHNYESLYGPDFRSLINELKSFKNYPKKYERLDVLSKLSSSNYTFAKYKLELIRNNIPSSSIPDITLNSIVDILHSYIYKFYKSQKDEIVILNNAFDIFSLDRPCVSDLNIPTLVVVRDPRDIWLSIIKNAEKYTPQWERNSNSKLIKDNLWPSDLNQFILKYKSQMKKIENFSDKILMVYFEDFCINPEKTIIKISRHINKSLTFQNLDNIVSKSRKNVALWNNFSTSKEILEISDNLKEYLYE